MSAKKTAAAAAPTEKHYGTLIRPLVTEKTAKVAEKANWLAFEVALKATKKDIKAAMQSLYGVEVERVNTLIQKGKNRGFGGRAGRRGDVKKAFVQLKSGQSLDLMAGVK